MKKTSIISIDSLKAKVTYDVSDVFGEGPMYYPSKIDYPRELVYSKDEKRALSGLEARTDGVFGPINQAALKSAKQKERKRLAFYNKAYKQAPKV